MARKLNYPQDTLIIVAEATGLSVSLVSKVSQGLVKNDIVSQLLALSNKDRNEFAEAIEAERKVRDLLYNGKTRIEFLKSQKKNGN
jgi:RNA-binding protein YhbY